MAKLYIDRGKERGHIQPELQGHFSEHLGRCIYEGIYVGEDSEIPNEKGMRRDVVEALREIRIPVLRWPGDALRTIITGRTASALRGSAGKS